MPLNSVTIIGNLGKDPEIRFTADKKQVAKFTVAVNEKFTKNGEKAEHVEWFNVVAFDRTAEIAAEYLAKGREVCVQGRLRTEEYEKNGEKKYWTSLYADRLVLLSGKKEASAIEPGKDTDFP